MPNTPTDKEINKLTTEEANELEEEGNLGADFIGSIRPKSIFFNLKKKEQIFIEELWEKIQDNGFKLDDVLSSPPKGENAIREFRKKIQLLLMQTILIPDFDPNTEDSAHEQIASFLFTPSFGTDQSPPGKPR